MDEKLDQRVGQERMDKKLTPNRSLISGLQIFEQCMSDILVETRKWQISPVSRFIKLQLVKRL